MEQRPGVHAITPDTAEWTCKVIVVDKYGPRESKDKRIRYVNMIFEDEYEDQVKAIIYVDEIPSLHEQFEVFKTYLITGARVQQPVLKSERPLHMYEWVIDKRTIFDPVNEDTPEETMIPLPQRLPVASLKDIKDYQDTNAEFDILAAVINCFPPKYSKHGKRLQELIVVDIHMKPLTFTIWEDSIIEDEGKNILREFKRYPIILARRITIATFNGISLYTKFNTSILIDPPYEQCRALQAWVIENKAELHSLTLKSTSKFGTLIPLMVDEETVQIAKVQTVRDGHTFRVEAKISIPNRSQRFYMLDCSNCGQELRFPAKRTFRCNNCNEYSGLTPRCRFEVELHDNSGTSTAVISGNEAEKILSLTAEQIYEITKVKNESLPMQDVENRLAHAMFILQVKKSFGKLFIQSCVETKNPLNALPAATSDDLGEGSKRKKQQLLSSDDKTISPAEPAKSLKMKQKLEPMTPVKMK